jgi:Rieske Fe-S protein
MNPEIDRRTALAAGFAGAGAVALAACSSSGGSSTSTTAASSSSAGQQVAALAEIKVGEAVAAKLDGKDVLVSRPTASTAACFSAICTHMGCTVQPDGTKLVCPCHGSVYDAKTGAVLQGPAPSPLHKIAVTVDNGEVVTTGATG